MFETEIKNNIVVIKGNNFSGRSNYLKALSEQRLLNKGTSKFVYIGEQPGNYISGIFPTVKNEIDLHTTETSATILKCVKKLFSAFEFEKHLYKNPFTLSGGEQAILVILSNLLLEPQKIAIDTTLEQLNKEWRVPLINAIQNEVFGAMTVYIADNRLDEYQINNLKVVIPNILQEKHEYQFESPAINFNIDSPSQSKTIEIKDLSFSYNKSEIILNKISIFLDPKKIYILKGKNGSGKTTLAKILTGILKFRQGKLLVNGIESSTYKFPGRLVGYSFQNPDEQIFSATVENEILIPLKQESSQYTERREIFLQMFGLQNIRKKHPAELPFVIRKRISLAATLANDRPWYILDEPTLGQDNSFVEFLVALINDLAAKGKGIIIISHSDSFIEKLNGKNLNLIAGKLTT